MSPSFMDYLTSLLILISIIWIFIITLTSNPTARKSSNHPPGPFQLPIIGNILVLGSKPHQSLAKLSAKYGPVMSLKLGSISTVVLSSPEAARAALQKHDLEVSRRAIPTAVGALSHDEYSMVWLPVGGPWRKLRKICREQMFSAARLDASQGLRREKLDGLRAHVVACCESGRAVDVGEAAFTTSLNLMSATLFSVEFAGFDSRPSAREMRDVVCAVMRCVGSPNVADYFPVLKRADPQGIFRETEHYFGKLFGIFDGIIDDKMKSKDKKVDLVEALIELNERGEFSRTDMKHLLLDLFAAGTDTTSSTVEWAMTELLRSPDKLLKLRNEVKDIIGNNETQIQESDITNLPYLQAVIKETFRLHPPAPLLVPHKAEADVEIYGHTILKNTQVLVNVWASGRDSSVWPNADRFEPERFLNDRDNIDYRGKDFELIPFGAGRRICPGLPLASRMVHLMLATLVGNFGWQLEEGVKLEDVDMDEKFGLTLQKAVPLMAVPTKL